MTKIPSEAPDKGTFAVDGMNSYAITSSASRTRRSMISSSPEPGKFVVALLFQRANISTAAAAAILMLVSVICARSPHAYIELRRQKR